MEGWRYSTQTGHGNELSGEGQVLPVIQRSKSEVKQRDETRHQVETERLCHNKTQYYQKSTRTILHQTHAILEINVQVQVTSYHKLQCLQAFQVNSAHPLRAGLQVRSKL